jgi:hypothetical protein
VSASVDIYQSAGMMEDHYLKFTLGKQQQAGARHPDTMQIHSPH